MELFKGAYLSRASKMESVPLVSGDRAIGFIVSLVSQYLFFLPIRSKVRDHANLIVCELALTETGTQCNLDSEPIFGRTAGTPLEGARVSHGRREKE
jgi:hypothetical protein